MDQAPKSITLSETELKEFCDRLEKNTLTSDDRSRLILILRGMCWLSLQLERGRLSIRRLKRLIFGEKTESRKNVCGTGAEGESNAAVPAADGPGIPDADPSREEGPKGPPPPKPGHGRRGASEYTGADRIFCQHPNLKAGDVCPDCGEGRLHASVDNGVFIQFKGNPPISGTIYETEKLRCGLCGKIFEAPLPTGVTAQKWDETAKTITVLMRYGYGFPHYRLEKFQADLGVPVSDSVAFELSNDVADSAHPIYRVMIHLSAQGELIHFDDMGVKILDLIRENKKRDPDKERVGMFTTAMIARVKESDIQRQIALFFTGRNHAGENIQCLLEKRMPGLSPPMLMSDGSSRNPPPKEFEAILLNCMTHGRRGFIDLMESFPEEIKYVIDTLALVYHYDAEAKSMTDEERLRFHQKMSGPLIEELNAWCRDHISNRKCEPNGPLGKSIKYMEKRWEELTAFLRIPGAPLSNDIVERIIKRCVLHRKNSLFYWTEHGAAVGDILMTLIHSTVIAKENPFDYLTAIQRHRHRVKDNPRAWLPWTYKATLATISSHADAQ